MRVLAIQNTRNNCQFRGVIVGIAPSRGWKKHIGRTCIIGPQTYFFWRRCSIILPTIVSTPIPKTALAET
jgi:hypothetical protein